MKRKFTFLMAAFMLLAFLAVPMGMRGQTRDTKTDVMFAKGFGNYSTNSFGAAGTDYSAVPNYTNATGVTYAMQVFNGSTGAVRGNKTGANNFSCRNTTTYDGYYISSVSLTVSGGTLDGSTSGRSVVYFGTSAYANPNTTAPSGTATTATPASSGQSTLTWTNTNENVTHFILYNLKTANTALSADSDTPLTVVWTQKSGGSTPLANIAALTANTNAGDYYVTLSNAVVTYVNGNYAYVQDESGAVLYYKSGHGLTAGDVLTGTATVTYQLSNNNPRITNLQGITPVSGTAPEPTSLPQSDWNHTFNAVLSQYFQITGATLTKTGNYYYIALGDDNVQLYKNGGSISTLDLSKTYTVVGFPMLYNSTKEILVFENPQVEVSTDPTITVDPVALSNFTYEEGNGPSTVKTISVSGSNLTANIGLSLGDGSDYEMSLTSDGTYSNSLTLTQSAGTVAATSVYVRLKAGLTVNASYGGTITLTSEGATNVTVSLSGSVTAPEAPNVTWDLSTNSYASASADLVTWSSSYVTMTNAKGTSQTPANNSLGGSSNDHTRFYKDQVLSITPASGYAISSVVITTPSTSYGNTFAGTWTNATASNSSGIVTITPTNGNNAVSLQFSAATRATQVKVFYAISTATNYTISIDPTMEDGTVVPSVTEATEGTTVTLTVNPAVGYYLEKDTDIEVDGSTTTPTLTKVAEGVYSFEMPAENVTVYAIFTTYTGTYYTLVSSTDHLIPGRHYIIASSKTNGTAYAMGAQNGNYRDQVATAVVGTMIYETIGVQEIVLSGDATNFWTLYDETTPGYLYAQANNYLKTRTDNTANENGKWAISISEGVATIVSQIEGTDVSNTIKYNAGNTRFSCYTSTSSMAPVYLYMKAGETDYELYSNTNYTNLTIGDIDFYTVHSPAVLNVTGSLTNNGNWENLVIKSGAQLKTPNAVNGTVEKFVAGYGTSTKGKYILLATPATMDACNETNMWPSSTSQHADVDFYSFDQSSEGEEWRNFKYGNDHFSGSLCMQQGQGFLYANKEDVTLTLQTRGFSYLNTQTNTPVNEAHPFVATNASQNVTVTYSDNKTFSGWNLIGNPYTCTAYLADGTQDFYRMNSTGDAIVLAASNERAIDVCEGIFVHCNATGTVTFTTTDPTVTSTGNNNGMVNISVAQVVNSRDAQPSADYARIRVNNGKDMTKFVFNENTSRVYIPQGNKDYAVVRSEARGEMPVNFKAAEAGTYTISVEAENLDVNYLHLIDNMTGMDIDLLATPSYTFEGKKSDYASRFKLVFSANAGNNEVGEDFAFISDGNIIILNEGEATLQVIDIMGRVISTQTVNGNASVNNVGAAGVYVLQLINGNNVKTQKIVVR